MSDHAARNSHDEDATSMTSSQAHRPSWMSRWINNSSKPGSTGENSSLFSNNKGHVDTRGSLMQTGLKIEDSLRSGKRASKNAEETDVRGCVSEDLTKKLGNFKNKPRNLPFPSLTLGQCKENASTVGAEVDQEFGHKSMALALAVGKEDSSREFNSSRSKQQIMPHLYQKQKGSLSRPCTYNKSDASKPVVVFERHFSNDNFTCFSQDRCKYQKSSSVLFHEKKMGNDFCHESGPSDGVHLQHGCPPGKKNFQSFFLKQQSQNVSGQPLDSVPCSFRNVETMRICTMVDSVEKSPGDPPKISQRAHHILFTKETCVNLSKGHQVIVEPTLAHQEEKTFGGPFSMFTNVVPRSSRGVKIQPLWTSTDDSEEKENTANPSICKAGSMNEASAETDGMQVEAPKNRHILLGMESSPLIKDKTMDESSPPAACDSSTEKIRSKRPISEIPDINEEAEELPGLQPAVSSTDGKDPSTSRVHSLNAKQLFSSHEQTSRSERNAQQERSLGPDSSNRWIKRLKVSSSDSFGVGTKSSDMGEGSSHEKFNAFFNRITKCNRESFDTKLRKRHGKEQMAIDQNVESLRSGSSSLGSKNRNQSMLGCSWIQRWCQNCTAPPPSNPEPLVICEPHHLKIEQDELAKKQFPSIAAMALMGKAMNGIRSCEFKKRGSIVVWNTKEF